MKKINSYKAFGGQQNQYKHYSERLKCEMHFSVFIPPQTKPAAVLYWLSGLTCTDQNFVIKAGAQRVAAELGLVIVCPDTSPRGENVPDDENGAWDLGLGAGFYVNATQAPWNQHYHMLDYVVQELPELIAQHFNIDTERQSIFGHSMGGHGALTIALKHTDKYKSVSAFAPMASPTQCSWGIKALNHYLGDNGNWEDYDSCCLIEKATKHLPMLIDQGRDDDILKEQLKTELLVESAKKAHYPATIRFQDGYDHSYFFIASFIEEHLRFHAKYLYEES